MRTIKFRGKRLDGEGWAYGYPLEKFQAIDAEPRIVIDTCRTFANDGYHSLEQYAVLPESVGQWTGLVDRHGKEIYEGDVLLNITNPLVDNEPFLIYYDTQEGMWMWFDKNEEGDAFNWAIAKHSEIIGNEFDNPELMEV